MNCANCGHDILDHRKIDAVRPAPCDHVFDNIPGRAVLCNCPNFEEPKPRLCVCGHPATSHEPAEWARFDEDDQRKIVGSFLMLAGPCNRGPAPCHCGVFVAPDDVKRGPTHQLDMSTVRDTYSRAEWEREGSAGDLGAPMSYRQTARALKVELAEANRKIDRLEAQSKEDINTMSRVIRERDKAFHDRDVNAGRALEYCRKADERTDKQRERVFELERWQREAMEIMPDYQAIGEELGLVIGDTVHDKILPALKNRRETIERIRTTLRCLSFTG